MNKYRDDNEYIDSGLGFQTRKVNFVKNDNGIPQEDVMYNGSDAALVRLRPMIHPFTPGGTNSRYNESGNYGYGKAPYFAVKANHRESNLMLPLCLQAAFLLKSRPK